MIERLEIKNIRNFENQTWRLSGGLCRMVLGPASGKTTWVECLSNLLLGTPDLAVESAACVRVKIRLRETTVDVTKEWKDGHVSEWRAQSDTETWDLRRGHSKKKWQHVVCAHTVGPVSESVLEDVYRQTILSGFLNDLRKEIIPAYVRDLKRLLIPAEWALTSDGVEDIYSLALERALKDRQHDANQSERLHRLEKIQHELSVVDRELQELVDARQRFEKEKEDKERDIRHLHRAYEFVVHTRSELQRLELEERLFQDVIEVNPDGQGQNGSAEAFEHFKSIERKIHQLESRNIENRHYEKNLRGLQEEVARLSLQDSERLEERASIYRDEMDRLRRAMESSTVGLEKLDRLYADLEKYRADAEKHKFFERRTTASAERDVIEQQLVLTRRKLDATRAELQGLDSDDVTSKYESELQTLRQIQQQIVEINRRIDSTVDRRLTLLEKQPVVETKSAARRIHVDTKTFLDLARKGLSAQCQQVRLEKLAILKSLADVMPPEWSRIKKTYVRSLENLDFQDFGRVSTTERLWLSILVQAAAARKLSGLPFCILPEHAGWLLPHQTIIELIHWLEAVGFQQIILFVPPQLPDLQQSNHP